jgi:hypothetical protein
LSFDLIVYFVEYLEQNFDSKFEVEVGLVDEVEIRDSLEFDYFVYINYRVY